MFYYYYYRLIKVVSQQLEDIYKTFAADFKVEHAIVIVRGRCCIIRILAVLVRGI